MKRKVLIITYYWPPSGGAGVQRILKFAKYLPEFGIEPVVLTVENPMYPIKDPSLENDIPGDVQVYKSKTFEPFGLYAGLSGKKAESIKPTTELTGKSFKSKLGSWIRANIFIPDPRAGWIVTARKKAVEIVKALEISTVLTTGPPHSVHLIGRYVQNQTGIKWIADFRDPWSQIYYNKIMPRNRFVQRLDEKLERSVLTSADEVVVVTKSQAEDAKQIYERKYRLIPNGFDPEDFHEIDIKIPEPSPLIIKHIGSLGETRVPEALLKALATIPDSFQLKIEFIGNVHKRLPELVQKYNLEHRILIRDYVPHRQALEEMSSAHWLLLCIPEREGIGKNMIPGKLFEYLGSGRPILLLGPENGDSAQIICELNAGVVSPFENADIKSIILSLKNNLQKYERELADANHPYSRKRATEKLVEIITPE